MIFIVEVKFSSTPSSVDTACSMRGRKNTCCHSEVKGKSNKPLKNHANCKFSQRQ